MRLKTRRVFSGVLAAGCITGIALACGTPPVPPPPPPPPPIVCCQTVQHFVDPVDPNFECIIIRYFRRDGLPLYQSNPMPLVPGQFCICSLPGLSLNAIQAGAKIVRTTFGTCSSPQFGCPPQPWQDIPPDQPPYGPFDPDPVPDPIIKDQVQQFYQTYLQFAQGPDVDGKPQIIRPPEGGSACELWGFTPKPDTGNPICRCDLDGNGVIDEGDAGLWQELFSINQAPDCNGDGIVDFADLTFLLSQVGTVCRPLVAGPGIVIPPDVFFDIYQKIRVPRGFDPDSLCIPNQIWILGLFFADGSGAVQLEPGIPGPGIPLPLYNPIQGDPGAIYKFRWYRNLLPPPCPPPCVGDADLSGVVNFADITAVLGEWLRVCPQ